jgi:hypothetical protein
MPQFLLSLTKKLKNLSTDYKGFEGLEIQSFKPTKLEMEGYLVDRDGDGCNWQRCLWGSWWWRSVAWREEGKIWGEKLLGEYGSYFVFNLVLNFFFLLLFFYIKRA